MPMMPPAWFWTGRQVVLFAIMVRRASPMSVCGVAACVSGVMCRWTWHWRELWPSIRQPKTRWRSVMMPASLPFSVIASAPVLWVCMVLAAPATVVSRSIVVVSLVIRSVACIGFSLLWSGCVPLVVGCYFGSGIRVALFWGVVC